MKRFQLIATALLLPLLGHGQAFVDDIYYSPGDEKVQAETPKAEPANYKNGAKEIVFIDSNSGEELYLDTDTIFLDNSSAVSYMCHGLMNMDITVLTNSLRVLNTLSKSKTLKLICIGGRYDADEEAFLGPTAVENLRRYQVDRAFFSCKSFILEKI